MLGDTATTKQSFQEALVRYEPKECLVMAARARQKLAKLEA
jgi:hypothetical protein